MKFDKTKLKKLWNDPVWSKVIAQAINVCGGVLILYLVGFCYQIFIRKKYEPQIESSKVGITCIKERELSNFSIPKFEESNITSSLGLKDGLYFTWTISFTDDLQGRLYQGSKSQKYYIESSKGKNYYYKDKKSAIRALYIYKKYGCISQIDTN